MIHHEQGQRYFGNKLRVADDSRPTIEEQIAFINDDRGSLALWLDMVEMEDTAPTRSTIAEAKQELMMYEAIQHSLGVVRDNQILLAKPTEHHELSWSDVFKYGGGIAVATAIILLAIYLFL